MKRKSLLFLVSVLAIPSLLVACNKDKGKESSGEETSQPTTSTTPQHEHSYDEFGICECGEIHETEGIEFISAGVESEHKVLAAGATSLFKLKGYKDHPISFGIAFFYDKQTFKLEWVQNGEVKKYDIKSGTFTPEVTGIYYVHAETDADKPAERECYVKYAYAVGDYHHFDEDHLCECGEAEDGYYTDLNVGAATPDFTSAIGDVHGWVIKMYKGDKYVGRSVGSWPGENLNVFYLDNKTGDLVKTGFDMNGLVQFNNGAFFVAPQTGYFYLQVKAVRATLNASFKLMVESHNYNEYGLCECGDYHGNTIAVNSPYDVTALGLNEGDTVNLRWQITGTPAQMAVGGTGLSTGHMVGLWSPKGVKLSNSGYGFTLDNPAAGYYYLIFKHPGTLVSGARVNITVS